MRALTFDIFGTTVDWRSGVSAEARRQGMKAGIHADWESLADAGGSGLSVRFWGSRPRSCRRDHVDHRHAAEGLLVIADGQPGVAGTACLARVCSQLRMVRFRPSVSNRSRFKRAARTPEALAA